MNTAPRLADGAHNPEVMMMNPVVPPRTLDDRTPREAIVAVLHAQGAMSAREVTEALCNARFWWTKKEGEYPSPTYERVYATLRNLEDAGEVTRGKEPRFPGRIAEFVWRLA